MNVGAAQKYKAMVRGGVIMRGLFVELSDFIQVGSKAGEIDDLIRARIEAAGAIPSFLGFQGYKYSSCVSVNEEIVHGLPLVSKVIRTGDVVSVDIGVFVDGYHVDAARTFLVGDVSRVAIELVKCAEDAFFVAISKIRVGHRLGECCNALGKFVKKSGFSLAKDLFSHGIGAGLHEEPLIPNSASKTWGPVVSNGLSLAIEPMICVGRGDILTLKDGWTIITADRSLSAHYENTVFVNDGAVENLTL